MSHSRKAGRPAHSEFVAGSAFLLRTPAYPVELLLGLSENGRLRALLREERFRCALELSSRSLLDAVDREGESERIPPAVVRYAARMAARCTPFGLCAGVSTGELGPTRLALGRQQDDRLSAHVDGTFAARVERELRSPPTEAMRARMPVGLNPTLFVHGRKVRFAAPADDVHHRRFELRVLDATPPMRRVVDQMSRVTHARLGWLVAETAAAEGVARREARAFVSELVAVGVLVPRLGFAGLGDPTEELSSQAREILGAQHPTAKLVEDVRALVRQAPALDPVALLRGARELVARTPYADSPTVVAVDLVKPAPSLALDPDVASEIARGATQLVRLCRPKSTSYLESFKQAFARRFDQETVPLLVALDPEIGASGTLLDSSVPSTLAGIPWRSAPHGVAAPSAASMHLLKRYTETLAHGRQELRLEEGDLRALAFDAPLPGSAAVRCRILAASEDAVRAGEYRVAVDSVVDDASSHLGRFARTDGRLEAAVIDVLRSAESERDTLYPELLTPARESRFDNLMSRPRLRSCELSLLSFSAGRSTGIIHLRDLAVRLDEGHRVILIHVPSGKRVAPRFASGYRPEQAGVLHIFRFLAEVGRQATNAHYLFGWEPHFWQLPFLPRVTWDRFVFRAASWLLPARVLSGGAAGARTGDRERRDLGLKLREELGLPRFVGLTDGTDEILPLDLDQDWALREVGAASAGGVARRMYVEEMLDVPGAMPVHGPEGRYRHEIVLPLRRSPPEGTEVTQATPTNAQASAETATRRAFVMPRHFPGGEWVYLKLYGASSVLEDVLRARLRPLLARLDSEGRCDRWFFLRYADPEPHLRLRLRTDSRRGPSLASLVLGTLGAYLSDGRIWDVALATYEPEVVRYGGTAGLDLCERIFHADSRAVLGALRHLEDDDEGRIAFAAHAIHQMLDAFAVELSSRAAWLESWADGWRRQLGLSTDVRHALGRRYAQNKERFSAIVVGDTRALSRPFVRLLTERSRTVFPLAASLRAHADEKALRVTLASVVESVVHMGVNRTMIRCPNETEVLLYDALARAYGSLVARAREGAGGR